MSQWIVDRDRFAWTVGRLNRRGISIPVEADQDLMIRRGLCLWLIYPSGKESRAVLLMDTVENLCQELPWGLFHNGRLVRCGRTDMCGRCILGRLRPGEQYFLRYVPCERDETDRKILRRLERQEQQCVLQEADQVLAAG